MIRTISILFFLLLFLTTSVYAEFKVKINISADENTKNQVNSYMLRELRDLRDVYINDDYQYAVDVIVAKSIIGYIVSSIVMEITVQPNEFLKLVNLKSTAQNTPGLVKAIRHASNKAHVLVHHVLLTDPNLKNICSKVVAELDSEVLEPQRVIQQYIQKIIQQHKKISD